jgi:hypothetical protein
MKTEISEPGKGVGASYFWSGNDKVGEGRLTITDIQDNRLIKIELEFLRPWEAVNATEWRIDENCGERKITWAMDGVNNGLVPRIFALFMNMDKMVGKDFETGLANLKGIVEQS